MDAQNFTIKDFKHIQQWLYKKSGIFLNENKQALVNGRLQKRIRELQLDAPSGYIRLLKEDKQEEQVAINLLTTNETYFFREQNHFTFLTETIIPQLSVQTKFRVWSAAASSGEEAYTVAFLLANALGIAGQWKILGTDINTAVLALAQRGVYPLVDAAKINIELLKKYCVKGCGKDQDYFMIRPELRDHLFFKQHNLMMPLRASVPFDLVFLRNVLIYFDLEDKQRIVQNVVSSMRPGAWLLTGHSESINGYDKRLEQHKPGCYRYRP